jgi:hypothetical protein
MPSMRPAWPLRHHSTQTCHVSLRRATWPTRDSIPDSRTSCCWQVEAIATSKDPSKAALRYDLRGLQAECLYGTTEEVGERRR